MLTISRKLKIYFLLFLVIVLGSFDAGVLWISLHPRVSSLYKEYYLKHSLSADDFVEKMKAVYPQGASPTDTPDSKL